MPTTWIVSGDASRARVLQVTGRNELEEIQDFVSPRSRLHNRDQLADAHPRFDGHGRAGGPSSDRQEMSAGEIEAQKFSKEIGRFLDQARIQKRYERLFLIAPPRFLGMMRKELGKEVQKLVREEIDKDLSWLDAREIDRYLKRNGTSAKYR